MLLNKALIISALLFQQGCSQSSLLCFLLGFLFFVVPAVLSGRLARIHLALLIPARLLKLLLRKNIQIQLCLWFVSGYVCLLQLVGFLMYHNWELICEQQHLEKINCVWNV